MNGIPRWWSKKEIRAYKHGLRDAARTLSPIKTTEGIWYLCKAAKDIKNAEAVRVSK